MTHHQSLDDWNAMSQGKFPGFMDMQVVKMSAADGFEIEMPLSAKHYAPNGFIHGGVVTALADTVCGYGCRTLMPAGAVGFTTIDLKINFIRTAQDGVVTTIGECIHAGRTTQVWTAKIIDKTRQKLMAQFQCTQMILWPSP